MLTLSPPFQPPVPTARTAPDGARFTPSPLVRCRTRLRMACAGSARRLVRLLGPSRMPSLWGVLLVALLGVQAAPGLAAAVGPGAPPAATHSATPLATPLAVPGAAPFQLKIVGGLGGLAQYRQFEEPFWRDQFPVLTRGQASATVVAFDKAGMRSHEVMRLMQLGVVPFGTSLLTNIVTVDPELAAMDLAGLNPDMASLRRSVAAFRPHFEKTMRERHRIQVLAVYVYPAQVVFCTQPFKGLSDLKGRRVRISNPSQGDLIRPFGAQPVTTEFAEVVSQVRSGNVDCAITGSMSGNAIGLHEVTRHISPYAVNWGLSMFGANLSAWQALPEGVRTVLQTELPKLEAAIWANAEQQNQQGLTCNTGQSGCLTGQPGHMQLVPLDKDDQAQLQAAIRTSVLPAWQRRCGEGCAAVWNQLLAPVTGVRATDTQTAPPAAPR